MDGKSKQPREETTVSTKISAVTQGPTVKPQHLSGNAVTLPTGNSTATQTQASTEVTKRNHKTESPSSHHHVTNLNSSQLSHPKKKSGFVITSVKDNVDGDESADDLDESHTSYSDVSYSKTPDIDPNQESSASEHTIHMTVQDSGNQAKNVHQNQAGDIALVSRQVSGTSDQALHTSSHQTTPQILASVPAVQQQTERRLSAGYLPGSSLEFPPELPSDPTPDPNFPTTQTINVKTPSGTGKETARTSTRAALSQTTNANQNQAVTQNTPVASNSKTTNTSSSATSVITNSASSVASSSASVKPTSSTNAALSKGGSRVYKVVKRETGQPVRREAGRWLCFDYGDVQTPGLGFVAQSASDSRLNFHDQIHIHSASQLPLSMSSTSVPSSSSAYSLQHSDSASSVQREVPPQTGSSSVFLHSASASSVSQDLEARKLFRLSKGAGNEALPYDDRLSGESISEQELLKNVMQSSGELSNNPDQDDESGSDTTSTGRIDNKIEAAMDLVKKHLMLAVRDEVDELKEKIQELTNQNEALRAILHPDQLAALRSKHSGLVNRSSIPYQGISAQHSQQVPLYQQQQSVDQTSSATSPEQGTVPPLPHNYPPATTQQILGQKHSNPSNAVGFSASNQTGPPHRPGPLSLVHAKPTSLNLSSDAVSAIAHSKQSAQQQMIQKQQHVLSQQQGPLSRTANYQQSQLLFQPNLQAPAAVPAQGPVVGGNFQQHGSPGLQLPPPLLQAMYQLMYSQLTTQLSAQQGQIPQGFQPTQGVVQQQPGAPALPQQTPVQATQLQSYQPQQATLPLQQAGQLKNAPVPQAAPPVMQGQFMQPSQSSAARAPVQVSQSATILPRQPQLPAPPVVMSPTMSGPTVHHHDYHPPLHGQQQMQFATVKPVGVPTPSGASLGRMEGVLPEQTSPPS